MNLHRAIVAVFLSQVVQGHVSHPAADSAKSPQKPDEELTEDEAAVAKHDQASAASSQAGVRNTVPWKGVGAETIDVGVIVSSSAARRDRRRQMKDGKRTSSMVSQKGTKNRRLSSSLVLQKLTPPRFCDNPASIVSLDETIETYDPYFDYYRIVDAPQGCIEFSACQVVDDPSYVPSLTMYLSRRVDDAADSNNCELFGYVGFNTDCSDDISYVTRLELEVATSLTIIFDGYGDFEVTTSKCKSSKSDKSQLRK